MIDLLILLAFIIYAISAGLSARRKASRGLDQYFLAGRSLRGWQAGTSMAATQFAADTPLLVTGLVATAGVFSVWRLQIYGIAFLSMAFVFSVLWRRAGVLTDAELTEIRYSGRGVLALRVLKAIYYGTVINCVVLAMVLVAAVRIAEVFLPWHDWLPAGLYGPLLSVTQATGMSLVGGSQLDPALATTNNVISIVSILAFTALYSATGGLRSVVATDVVQFSLSMLGTLVYAYVILSAVGGLGDLGARLVDLYGSARAGQLLSFTPSLDDAWMPFLIVVGLQWFFQMNSDGTGYLAQRCMACRTDGDARTAGMLFAWLQIGARTLLWMLIAAGLLVIYPIAPGTPTGEAFIASREILFVTGIDELLPVGIRGLMLTGLLAALASTVDTHLNWGASYWSNDIYKRLLVQTWMKRDASGRELVLVARLSNVLVIAIALVIMANLGSIQGAWFISLLFGAGVGAVLVLRWLWERVNLYAELAAMAISLTVAPVFLIVTEHEWIRLSVMALASTAGAVLVTLLTPRQDPAVLARFYTRVRPPGFWSDTARSLGIDPKEPRLRLAREIRTIAYAAASLFLAVYGVGTLLLTVPGEPRAWSWLALVTALALVPAWWKRLRL